MGDPVSIDFQLSKHGWASFSLTIGNASANVGPFGHGTDALGDLVRAGLMVASSGYHAEVTFDGEPKEWRLLLGSEWNLGPKGKSLAVRIKTFPNAGLRSPETDGILIFEAETTADEFGSAVELAARSIWERYGADGYNKVWNPIMNPFPVRALNALALALTIEEPPFPVVQNS